MIERGTDKKYGYVYQMSWFESKRHHKSHTDMYFAEEEHTRWGHCDELCRISVVKVHTYSNEYVSAVENSEREKYKCPNSCSN